MAVNDLMKVLDAKKTVILFKNQMGSYTAVVCDPDQHPTDAMEEEHRITDDFTPAKALARLAEKFYGNIM